MTGTVPIQLHIAHHLGEVVDFAELAKRLGMGYTLFRRSFQEYNGMAPLEYQIALRIRRAMNLLSNSDVPIAQIAHGKVPFALSRRSQRTFVKRFKTQAAPRS